MAGRLGGHGYLEVVSCRSWTRAHARPIWRGATPPTSESPPDSRGAVISGAIGIRFVG